MTKDVMDSYPPPFRYTHGKMSIQMPAVYITILACRLVWSVLRGCAYTIGLCLRPQLRVPLEGWRVIMEAIEERWVWRTIFVAIGLIVFWVVTR